MSSQPAPEVAAWVAAQPEERLYTTAVCQAEILAGIEILPDGRRRRALEAVARANGASMVTGDISGFEAVVSRSSTRGRRHERRRFRRVRARLPSGWVSRDNDASTE